MWVLGFWFFWNIVSAASYKWFLPVWISTSYIYDYRWDVTSSYNCAWHIPSDRDTANISINKDWTINNVVWTTLKNDCVDKWSNYEWYHYKFWSPYIKDEDVRISNIGVSWHHDCKVNWSIYNCNLDNKLKLNDFWSFSHLINYDNNNTFEIPIQLSKIFIQRSTNWISFDDHYMIQVAWHSSYVNMRLSWIIEYKAKLTFQRNKCDTFIDWLSINDTQKNKAKWAVQKLYKKYYDTVDNSNRTLVDQKVTELKTFCEDTSNYDFEAPQLVWTPSTVVIMKGQTLTDARLKQGLRFTDNKTVLTDSEWLANVTIVSWKPTDTNTTGTFTINMKVVDNFDNELTFTRTLKIVDLNLSQLTPLLAPLPNADKLINDSNKTDYDNLINQWKNLSATTQTEVDDLVDKIQKAKAKLRFDTTAPTLTFDTLTPSIKVWETFDKFAWLTTTDDIDTTTSQTDWNNKTTVTSSPTLNTNQVGTYTLTYKVKDNHNNEATITRTLKVNPVNKTQLTTNLNNLRDKLNDSKTVRNNKYNEANTWYQTNKNKPTDQNLTQTEVTTLENKANQLLGALSNDTIAPTIAYTYSANFQQFAQSKEITVGITDNISTNPTWKYALVSNNVTCDNSVTYSNLPTDKKITLNVEASNNKKLCVKAEDDNQNIAYLGSNEITKIDRTAPVINLTETTKTFKVGVHTTLNLKNNIASVSDNLETTLNANNVVIKNITDIANPITTSTLNNIQVGTYKMEYSLTDTAWNEATKKIYTIIVQENDKTDLNTLISTINTKLSNPKLVNNSAKTDLENYKTTITNAIANRNITQAQIDTIKSNAQAKINALRFDTTAPVITETQQLSFDVGEPLPSGYEFRWLTLSDDNVSEADLRARITANTSNINPNVVWNYEVSYSLTDNNGNTNSSFKRIVKIKENDKRELNRLINEIENSLGSNLEPSARATVVAVLAPHKVVSNNVNAKKPQIQQSITDLRNYKNTFNTQFPEPVFISSITHYTRGQTPIYKHGIRALDKVWGNDISAQITYQDLWNKVVYKVSNGKRIKTLEIPYRDPTPSHSSSSSDDKISWDIGWSGDGASSVFRWGNDNSNTTSVNSSQSNNNSNNKNNRHDIENILNKNSSNNSNIDDIKDILNKDLANKNNKNKKNSFQEKEHENAYNWALKNKIIDKKTFPSSWIYGNLSRAELATIVSNFAKMQKRKVKFSKEVCSKYKDLWEVDNLVLKEWLISSCQYGLMGMNPDWKTQITYFEPNKTLYRYDLSTVLSRMLYWTTYENKTWKGNYWDFHLKNLVNRKIISDANPNIKEIKQWVLLMLMRYSK